MKSIRLFDLDYICVVTTIENEYYTTHNCLFENIYFIKWSNNI